MRVGLTGKSCSGKDRVARMLPPLFSVIDEDRLGHEALEKNRDALVTIFGEGILTAGEVDRKKLGGIVFADKDGLEKLESVSHPWMRKETERLCAEAEREGRIAVINAAILERMGFVPMCDRILFIDAPYSLRLERALKRDGVTPLSFSRRDSSQKDIGMSLPGEKTTVITNDGEEDSLYRQVKDFCDKIALERVI